MTRLILLVLACVTLSLGSPIYNYKPEYRVHPFAAMPKTKFDYIDGATVNIEFGYSVGHDRLTFDYQGAFGISGFFDRTIGALFLTGKATTSEYNSALASVVFVTTSQDGNPRKITWAYGESVFYFSLVNHYYKYIKRSGLSWNDAWTVCNSTSYFDFRGYLATVTSAEEQQEIGAQSTFTAWLGGSDKTKEGEWRWIAGPEGDAETVFWQGPSMYAGGATPKQGYAAWNRFQPNNGNGDDEDFLYLVNSADQDTSYWADGADTAVVEGFICEFGGWDTLAIEKTLPLYSGSSTLFLDCGLFLKENECNNRDDYGCTWLGSRCIQRLCTGYHTEKSCESDWRCDWQADGPIGLCANTRCSKYATQAVCATDNACSVKKIAGVSQCFVGKCTDRTTSCSCNEMDGCVWRNGKCGSKDTIDCNGMDVVFLLDGSSVMNQPFGRFDQGFWSLTEMIRNTNYALTGTVAGQSANSTIFGQRFGFVQYGEEVRTTAGTNVGTNGRLSGVFGEIEADIKWHQSNFAGYSSLLYANSALSTAINMFDPTDGRKRLIVMFGSNEIIDAAALVKQVSQDSKRGGVLAALLTKNIKLVTVPIRPSETATVESRLADKSLELLARNSQLTVSTTLTFLRERVLFAICDHTSVGGAAFPSQTSYICSDYKNEDSCQQDAFCAWDHAAEACENSGCLTECNAAQCEAHPSCSSDGAQCVQLCSRLNATDCVDNSNSIGTCWMNYELNYCENAHCVQQPTEDGCIADPHNCFFDPTLSLKCQENPCFSADSKTCLAIDGCSWNGNECFLDICANQTTSAQCASRKQCSWNLRTGKCAANYCGKYINENNCQRDRWCQWSTDFSPPICGPRPCFFYNNDPQTAQAFCVADTAHDCFWQPATAYGQKAMCVQKTCELMRNSAECSTLEGCVWRNEQCKDSTFVQCPAIDVVFLVEATAVMLRPFQRHPNGYYGIVEALRDWSKEAPFSNATRSLASTGFRMAMLSYGAPRALAIPSDIITGGNLTDNPEMWYGNDQVLDWFEGAVDAYARNGGGTVAIGPALFNALEIFQQNPAPERTKLVVILGNSPITDGSKNLDITIEALETMGVKIFANIIRRFSVITQPDLQAAEFMRPIASDPPTEFFSFSTVDNMKETLLEKFCDPSTKTGEVLQISRDREVPCVWLRGEQECNIQGSCVWNVTAEFTCPDPNQCPNLGCVALPDGLQGAFECTECELVSGAFQCSKGTLSVAPVGQCQKAACMYKTEADCGLPDCQWNQESQRCERNQCQCTTMEDCNADLGCVWNQVDPVATGSNGNCQKSICGKMRAAATCAAINTTISVAGYPVVFNPCAFDEDLTPPICTEMRCPMMNPETCQSEKNLNLCTFNQFGVTRQCEDQLCNYDTSELCEMNSQCVWNQFDLKNPCIKRVDKCVLSGYSDWAPCSSSCGSATTFKTRSIIQFAETFVGLTCGEVARSGCEDGSPNGVANCDDGKDADGNIVRPPDDNITEVRSCASPGEWIPPFPGNPHEEGTNWPECSDYCAAITDRLQCIDDNSCRWLGSKCQVKPFMGCVTLNQSACEASDMCAYNPNMQICAPVMNVCPYYTAFECGQVPNCQWHDGTYAISQSNQWGLPAQLFNPGQKEIYPLNNLKIDADDIIHGASVTIETNYQRGKDILDFAYGSSIHATWIEQSGTLRLSGIASVSDYSNALRYVTFSTTSTMTHAPRTITWSFGNNTMFSSLTGHHYRTVNYMNATYNFAFEYCQQRSLYGLRGYLATVTSMNENDIISSKVEGVGWISGNDKSEGYWTIDSGPEKGQQFWKGGSSALGGSIIEGGFANWLPPTTQNINGEPVLNSGAASGQDRVYLARSGYWESRLADSSQVDGFVCEFGGSPTDLQAPYPTGGGMVVGIAGCVTHMCLWHSSEDLCNADVECQWQNGMCVEGCASRSTESECSQAHLCLWDSSSPDLPPFCDINRCAQLSMTACAIDPKCAWDAVEQCVYREGCGKIGTSLECNAQPTCMWNGGRCDNRPCTAYSTVKACLTNARCRWDSISSTCADAFCITGSKTECLKDKDHCLWNSPDSITVGFPPNGAEVMPLDAGLEPPQDLTQMVDGVTVMIAEGFQRGHDMLSIDPNANLDQRFVISYNAQTGVLVIRANAASGTRAVNAYSAFEFMQKSVKFSSDSTNPIRRKISYVLSSDSFYSTSSAKYFKWIQTTADTLEKAQQTCRFRTLSGKYGNLATIENAGDNFYLTKLGASGWFSAQSDALGQWSWIKSSGNTVFWKGTGALGKPEQLGNHSYSQFYYAQWAPGEPSTPSSFGYITPDGFWKAIKNSGVQSQNTGVICEFDLSQSQSTNAISGFRDAIAAGCFVAPCLSLSQSECKSDPQCLWNVDEAGVGTCGHDTACLLGTTPDICSGLELCTWDYANGLCRSALQNLCSSQTKQEMCETMDKCIWNPRLVPRNSARGLGGCVLKGCAAYSLESSCNADPICQWTPDFGPCAPRLCGYQSAQACWRDNLCVWEATDQNEGCLVSACALELTATGCNNKGAAGCQWNTDFKQCQFTRCAAGLPKGNCLNDTSCLYLGGECSRPDCSAATQDQCVAIPGHLCYFSDENKKCFAQQCLMHTSLSTCEQAKDISSKKKCVWVAGENYCRQATFAEQNAAANTKVCEREENPNLWWLWLYLAVILILLGVIIHRLYLAWSQGFGFFEPTRKNYKYNPHQAYASELFEEAKQVGVESNLLAP